MARYDKKSSILKAVWILAALSLAGYLRVLRVTFRLFRASVSGLRLSAQQHFVRPKIISALMAGRTPRISNVLLNKSL